MKKNKMFKIMLTILMLVVLVGVAGSVLAEPGYIAPTPTSPGSDVQNDIGNVTGKVLFIVQMVGYAIAVVMLIVLGIKFITASPDGKAEIKKSAWIYVVGAIGIFAASFIVGVLEKAFTGME